MSELDRIPPDQRAVLQLVLQQGRSYEDLASLLGIDPGTVGSRAHEGVAALTSELGVDADERAAITDYLLGQQSVSAREATRELLGRSAPARSWAGSAAGVLSELSPDLPEIPSDAQAPAPPREPELEPAVAPAPAATPPLRSDGTQDEEPEPSSYFGDRDGESRFGRRVGSRLGGLVLLGGVGIVVLALALILIFSGGDSNKSSKSDTVATEPTNSAARNTTGATPDPIAQISLRAADGSRAVGLAQVFARGSQRAVIVAGQGVAQGAYALWLYNSQQDARLLGFVPARVGKDGRFVTQGNLPSTASKFKELIISRETVARTSPSLPKAPGAIVLRGALTGIS